MAITEILTSFTNTVINFLPNLAGAMILLLIGWLVGLVLGRVTKEILRRLKVDEYIARGKKPVFRLSDIFSVIVTWSIYLVFIQASVDTLGIAALSSFLQGILSFIPGLVKAIIVVVVGYGLAEYVRHQVESSGVTYSELMGRILFFLIIYIAIAMALPLVGIDPFLVNALLLVIAGSVGVGLAIAIGFGLREDVVKVIKKYGKKLK
ncbi:MAG: hypothetical protein J4452_04690 [Candidatus Aenigmarchaeota archaeon]|nr:hypothetical protein [Candidatus Aenigmarchaeota archaeon]